MRDFRATAAVATLMIATVAIVTVIAAGRGHEHPPGASSDGPDTRHAGLAAAGTPGVPATPVARAEVPAGTRADVSEDSPGAPAIGSTGTGRGRLRVLDAATGAPVPGATVQLDRHRLEATQTAAGHRSTAEFLLRRFTGHEVGHTDSAGEIELPLRCLRQDPLRVITSRHRDLVLPAGPYRALVAEVLEVRLEPPGAATLEILLPGGEPAAGAQITVGADSAGESRDARDGGGGTGRPARRLRTDPRGRVTLALHADTQLLTIEHPGCASVRVLAEAPRQRVHLEAGRAVTGRVIDEHGMPVARALIEARTDRWPAPPWLVSSGRNGGFTLPPLPLGGTATLRISAAGRVPATHSLALPCDDPPEIRLATGCVVTGVLRDAGGIPTAGTVLVLPGHGAFPSRDVARCDADEDGCFRGGPVAAGDHVLRGEAVGGGIAHEFLEGLVPGVTRRDLWLPAPRRLRGQVVDTGGRPRGGVPIRVGTVLGDELRGAEISSDPDGRFEIAIPAAPAPPHRPRRRTVRWRALEEPAAPASTGREPRLLLETFWPWQLVAVDDRPVPRHDWFGSRNTCAVDPADGWVNVVVLPPDDSSPVCFTLIDGDGTPVRAHTNLVLVSRRGDVLGTFAGYTGQPQQPLRGEQLAGALVMARTRGRGWVPRLLPERSAGSGAFGFITLVVPDRDPDPPRLRLLGRADRRPIPGRLLLVAPGVPEGPGRPPPPGAFPIGRTDAAGEVDLDCLGAGHYRLSLPHRPRPAAPSGREPLALPTSELISIGSFRLPASGPLIELLLDEVPPEPSPRDDDPERSSRPSPEGRP